MTTYKLVVMDAPIWGFGSCLEEAIIAVCTDSNISIISLRRMLVIQVYYIRHLLVYLLLKLEVLFFNWTFINLFWNVKGLYLPTERFTNLSENLICCLSLIIFLCRAKGHLFLNFTSFVLLGLMSGLGCLRNKFLNWRNKMKPYSKR